MADYTKLTLLFVVLAYHLHTACMGTSGSWGIGGGNNRGYDSAVKAMFVLTFLFLLVAQILVLLINYLGESNKAAKISLCVFSFLGVLTCIMGVAIYGARVNGVPPYSCTVYIMVVFCAFLGGLFQALELAGV